MSNNGSQMLCIYCNKPWSPQMDTDLTASAGCDTCGFGTEIAGEIIIRCGNCDRIIYRKEVSHHPYG